MKWTRKSGVRDPFVSLRGETSLYWKTDRIDKALRAYELVYEEHGDGQDELRNFLTDLRHFADREGLDMEETLAEEEANDCE